MLEIRVNALTKAPKNRRFWYWNWKKCCHYHFLDSMTQPSMPRAMTVPWHNLRLGGTLKISKAMTWELRRTLKAPGICAVCSGARLMRIDNYRPCSFAKVASLKYQRIQDKYQRYKTINICLEMANNGNAYSKLILFQGALTKLKTHTPPCSIKKASLIKEFRTCTLSRPH